MDTEKTFPDAEQMEQSAPAGAAPPQADAGGVPQEGGEPSWEAAASAKKKADPMPLRLAAVLAILFGAFNTIINGAGLAGEIGGQNVFGGLGLTALAVVLLLIGLLQILSGITMFKAIGQEAYRTRCKQLGMAMLIVTVAYMVPVFMIRRQFIPNTLFGPIVSVVYLTVQKAWEKPAEPEKKPEQEEDTSPDSEKFPPL